MFSNVLNRVACQIMDLGCGLTLVYYITYTFDYDYNRTLDKCDIGIYSEYDLQLKPCSHNGIGNIIVIHFYHYFIITVRY